MTRAHVLVAYATTDGQTEKVARRVAEELAAAGHTADPVNLADADAGGGTAPDVGGYDGVVAGALR